MSNYLNNLVVRQLDSENLVQPRLSSLFEPPAFASRTLSASNLRVNEPGASLESIAFNDSLSKIDPIERGLGVSSETGNPLSPSTSSFPSSSDQTPGTVWHGRQNLESTASSRSRSTSNKPAEGEQKRGAHSQRPSAVSPETPDEPWRNSREPSPASPLIERERKADHEATAARLIQTTIDEIAIAETRRAVESSKDSRLVRPRVELAHDNRRAGNDSVMPVALPASEPAPVINVTIGRIEVRATTPSTSGRKQPSVKPLMSLDEYLQRRTRGGTS